MVRASKDFQIADPNSVFRGLTYGQWAGVWLNNLLSEKPDFVYREGKGMAFLRGNVEFTYSAPEDPKKEIFSLITQEKRITIQKDTAVFIPVICTMLGLGDEYLSQVLNDELSLRSAARRDTVNGGEVGLEIRAAPSNTGTKMVEDLNDFYIETPLFPLYVPKASAYRNVFQSPVEPGNYQALMTGIFVIVSRLEAGNYRLSFYGRGLGKYLTKSVYDIEVLDDEALLPDISGRGTSTGPFAKNLMDFVGNWKDKDSTK
jgi:hypothetical protein